MWQGGVHGGGHAWQVGHVWQGCVHGGGHALWGVCMAGGMHGRGHALQRVACMAGGACVVDTTTGWPRHRENREFGSYFFQTGKTQGIWF